MKYLFILLALCGLYLSAQNVPGYVPTNGLAGWWPFNANANDASGNARHLQISGTSAFTLDRNNANNASIYLDGNNSYLSNSSSFFNASNDHSINLWVNFLSYTSSGATVTDRGLFNTFPHPLHAVEAWSYNSSQTSGSNNSAGYVGNSVVWNLTPTFYYAMQLPINTWKMWTMVKSGANYKVYLDGILVNQFTHNGNVYTSNTGVMFGAMCGGPIWPDWEINGKIDDIGVWNRALTPAEVQTLYFGCNDTLAQNPTSATSTVGSSATFSALSTASGATYQWQAKNGSNFVSISNAGQFSGATSSTLTVTSVSSANNGLQVRCIVDHGDCVDTSNVATLTACFDVTNQPSDRYVVAGTSTTLGLTTNDPSSCTYQWQTNAGFGYQNLSNAGQYSGTTSSTLAVSNVSATNNNQLFRCIVTAGTCKDTTSEARIILSGVGMSESTLHQLVLSPNPTSGIVRFNQPIEGSYRVITSDGRTVQKGEMGESIDLSAYPDGVYQIEVQSSNERRTFKVVKKR